MFIYLSIYETNICNCCTVLTYNRTNKKVLFYTIFNTGKKSKSFTQRITWNLWSKFLYSDLQLAISHSQNFNNTGVQNIQDISSLLLGIVSVWVDSDSDTIFSASICLNTALLLREIGDFRSSLTLLMKVREDNFYFMLSC